MKKLIVSLIITIIFCLLCSEYPITFPFILSGIAGSTLMRNIYELFKK